MRRRAGLLLMLFIFSISPEAKAGLTDASLEIANLYDQSSSGLTSVSGYFVDPDVQMQSASDFNGGIITGLPGPYIPMTLVPFAGDPLELVATNRLRKNSTILGNLIELLPGMPVLLVS